MPVAPVNPVPVNVTPVPPEEAPEKGLTSVNVMPVSILIAAVTALVLVP